MDIFENGEFNKENNQYYEFLGLGIVPLVGGGIAAGISAIKKKKQAKHYQQKANEYTAMFPIPTTSAQAVAGVDAIKKVRNQKEIDQLNSKAKSTKKDLQDEIDILKDMEKVFSKAATDLKYEEEKKAAVIPANTPPVENQLQSTIEKAPISGTSGSTMAEQGSVVTQEGETTATPKTTNKNLIWVGLAVVVGVTIALIKKK